MAIEKIGPLVKRLRDERGLTQGQLATYARVTRSWLSRVEIGDIAKPEREMLEEIARVLQAPSNTLLAAAGYRVTALPPRPRRTPQEIVQELEAAIRQQQEAGPILVPEVEQLISAGTGIPGEVEMWPYYPQPNERGHHFVAVRVKGTCMEPEIREGEGVIVDKDASPQPGDIVAAVHDDENIVKYLEQREDGYYLVALRDRPPIKINGETVIIGVVRFAGRRMRKKQA